MDDQSNFRVVNQSLGDSPSLGPLPGNQLIPWHCLLYLGGFLPRFVGLDYLKRLF
jgi:hypothetical protein